MLTYRHWNAIFDCDKEQTNSRKPRIIRLSSLWVFPFSVQGVAVLQD